MSRAVPELQLPLPSLHFMAASQGHSTELPLLVATYTPETSSIGPCDALSSAFDTPPASPKTARAGSHELDRDFIQRRLAS